MSKFFMQLVLLIGNIIGPILRLFGLQNVIIFEAEKGTTQNTLAVFKEMLYRDWNDIFRFVLVSKTPQSFSHLKSKRISVYKRPRDGDSWLIYLRLHIIKLRTVMIIDENIQIRKGMSKTKHIYLTHGSPVKSTRGYYTRMSDTDFALCQSEFWRPIVSYEGGIPADRRVILGQPRNDALFSSNVSMAELFGKEYKKVVVWYPTFRQRSNRNCLQNTDSAALPIIHDEAAAKQINEIASKYGVLLVVKPHPVQDLSLINTLNLDHLKLIYDDFFVSHGISPYAFLGKTDALITDYSSVFFDYLLTRKPIALAQEDYEEYEKKVGFAVDMDMLRSCSVKLENVQDFETFFCDLISGTDPLREKREELMHLTNQYVDGNSTKRVVDWLERLLEK